ncbi:MAG: hypothetical protein SGJ27_25915 [Candidatus Melainabacteria bacterium]|nr:hypothetical protein [Candidatus Melainabacteria bacterium]
MSILRRSNGELSLLLSLALLFAGAANAASDETVKSDVSDPARAHAEGPDKTGTAKSGGVPYASSPETAAPGVSPKLPAKQAAPGGTTTIAVPDGPAGEQPASDAKTVTPTGLPGTALPAVDAPSVPTSSTPPATTVPADQKVKAPQSNGKPQIGLQFPSHKQLAPLLRMNQQAAINRIKIAEARCRKQLALSGMDPNINIDDAMALGKPVINIYCKKSVGDNVLAHGFCLQAYLCQYRRKPSGRIETVRFARIGESPEVYSGADFEDKAVGLVDAYLSARHHQLKEKSAATKGKPAAKHKKTK